MKMSQKTQEELLPRLRQRYVSGNREGKGRMLDEFCEQWQCDRKHAIKLFSGKVGWGGRVRVKRGAPTSSRCWKRFGALESKPVANGSSQCYHYGCLIIPMNNFFWYIY